MSTSKLFLCFVQLILLQSFPLFLPFVKTNLQLDKLTYIKFYKNKLINLVLYLAFKTVILITHEEPPLDFKIINIEKFSL